jgi:hypothetical protein
MGGYVRPPVNGAPPLGPQERAVALTECGGILVKCGAGPFGDLLFAPDGSALDRYQAFLLGLLDRGYGIQRGGRV